jgi:Fe-S-cluster containining protein
VITCLSFHAGYRCRQSGACCRAGWAIPFDEREAKQVRTLQITGGSLSTEPAGRTIALRRNDGACTFFGAETHDCAIHRAGGHAALPVSCRIFPRIVRQDARGAAISLSHYCPTAAALLFEEPADAGAPAIVEAPPAFADVGPLEGLDARQEWPPLLRPGVLMDLDGYALWERRGVDLLTRPGVRPAIGMTALTAITARIVKWSPSGAEPLHDAIEGAFDAFTPLAGEVIAADDRALKRWLAARLFANWMAYQGDGLAAIVAYLEGCLETFQREVSRDNDAREAIRRSDLLILHQA